MTATDDRPLGAAIFDRLDDLRYAAVANIDYILASFWRDETMYYNDWFLSVDDWGME